MARSMCLSVVTLKCKCINASIKRHKVTEWVKKHDLSICCLQETPFKTKDTYRLKLRR